MLCCMIVGVFASPLIPLKGNVSGVGPFVGFDFKSLSRTAVLLYGENRAVRLSFFLGFD